MADRNKPPPVPLRIPPSLKNWVINNIQLGRQIGRGANGRILEAKWEGTEVAVKEIHSIFMNEVSEEEFRAFKLSFLRECEQSSQLRHPSIARFFGIYLPPGARVPSLVLERLHCSLTNLLERIPVIPIGTKLSILNHVALGVRYLHSHTPPIIHRDLSSNNVLLSKNMEAKIGDLGTLRLVDPAKQSQMTTAPGTIHFMPPEVLAANLQSVRYGKELDVFSFGCVMLHILSHQWPTPSEPVVTDPVTFEMKARSEVERRRSYFDRIDRSRLGVLIPLIESCLSSLPKNRTSIVTQCEQLEGLVREHISDLQQQPVLQTKNTEIQSKNTQMQHHGAQYDGRDEVDLNKIDMPVSDISKLQCSSPHRLTTESTMPTISSSMQKQVCFCFRHKVAALSSVCVMSRLVQVLRTTSSLPGRNVVTFLRKCGAFSIAELDGKVYTSVTGVDGVGYTYPFMYDLHEDCWFSLHRSAVLEVCSSNCT